MARSLESFADRLNHACDMHPRAPAEYGRQAWVRRQLALHGKEVSSTAVTNWFNGYTQANFDIATLLATILGVDPQWLIFGHGERPDQASSTPSPSKNEEVRDVAGLQEDTFDLPVPIRSGMMVLMKGVPFNLSEGEARKLGNVLLALAQAKD